MTVVIPAHSTVPRWAADPPSVDPTGRTFAVLSFGAAAAATAAAWREEIEELTAQLWCLDAAELGASELAEISAHLREACVGLRLMVAGPEHEVLAVQALAGSLGLNRDEMAAHVTASDVRAVYCVHCRATTSLPAAVGSVAPCGTCGRGLMIFAHLSRHSGSYLGYLADAEEL